MFCWLGKLAILPAERVIMNEQSVWAVLGGIEIGAIVSWIVAISAVIGAIAAAAIRLYKVFDKYQTYKQDNDTLRKKVEKHEETDKLILERLDAIQAELDEQRGTKIKEMKHTLVSIAEEAISEGTISIRAWRSFLEIYDDYRNKYNQNSYVLSLYKRMENEVHVVGKLDEHGNDID